MKLINFYKNLDSQTNGKMSNYFIFMIIPLIVASILSYGFETIAIIGSLEGVSAGQHFWSIIINYIFVMVIFFFVVMLYFTIPELMKKIVRGFQGLFVFKDMIHRAANEELKTPAIDMSPDKSEFKIKG